MIVSLGAPFWSVGGEVPANRSPLASPSRIGQIAKAADWRGRIVTVPSERVPEKLRWKGLDPAQDIVVDTSRIRQGLGYGEHIDQVEAFRRTIA